MESAQQPPGPVVALVFTDVEGSTRLWQRYPDATRRALEVHDGIVRRIAAEHGGYEIRTEGDSFKLAFGSPADAVRFCIGTQLALLDADWPPDLLADERCAEINEGGRLAWRGLRVRMGAHFGVAEPKVHPVTARTDWFGPTVNATARIAEAPAGGQVVTSALLWDAARRQDPGLDVVVEDHGEHCLRGVELPEHLVQITPSSLAGRSFPPLKTETAGRMRIPTAHDAFVGRDHDIEAIDTLLHDARVVTLHGPGGTGKTRLALEVARRRGHAWPGGAWFVDLSEARGAGDASAAVLAVIRAQGAVGPALARLGRALVVLDNLEQLGPDALRAVAAWLEDAPDLRLLVTSQRALGLAAERRYGVEGLDVDAAVALFVDRAGRLGASASDRAAVARLVDRLDRLPLAIELAAARAVLMAPAEIERRLEQRFRLLSGGTGPARHATLRAAIAWSWDLLDPAEKAAAAQCAVFAGGFTVEAAEGVVALPGDAWVVDVLQALLQKSILRPLPDRRLGMFDSVRAFALEQLGPGDDVRERHARWFATAASRWAAGVYGRDDLEAYRSLRAESDNLLAAHDHLRRRDPLAAAHLIDAMGPEMLPLVNAGPVNLPSDFDGRLAEAIGAATDLALRARLLRQKAERRRLTLDSAAAFGDFRQALEVAIASGDKPTEAMLRRDLAFGISFAFLGAEEAEAQGREAVRLFEAAGEPVRAALALFAVALVVRTRDPGSFEGMRHDVSARILAHGGPARNAQRGLSGAIAYVLQSRFGEAWDAIATGRETFGRLGLPVDPFILLFGVCGAAAVGRIDEAQRMLGEARDVYGRTGDPQLKGLLDVAVAFVALARGRCARDEGPADEAEARFAEARDAVGRVRAPAPDGGPSIEAMRPVVRSLLDTLRQWAGADLA